MSVCHFSQPMFSLLFLSIYQIIYRMFFMWKLKLHKLCEFFHLFSKSRNCLSSKRERETQCTTYVKSISLFLFHLYLLLLHFISFLILAYYAYYYTFKWVTSDYKYHLGLIIEQEKRKPINHKV